MPDTETLDYASSDKRGVLTRTRSPSKPPGKWFILSIALLSVVSLYNARLPFREDPGVICVLLWFIAIVVWFTRLMNRPIVPQGWSTRRTLLVWCSIPIFALVTAVLIIAHLPLRAAFAISKPALQTIANDALAGRPTPAWGNTAKRAGLYYVRSVEILPNGGVAIITHDVGFIFSVGGFVYFPAPISTAPISGPNGGAFVEYEPLAGPWYQYHWSD